MNRALALGCASALLAGCVSRPLRVSRGEVFAHVPQLRASGEARVELESGGATTLRMRQAVEVETKTSWLWGLVEGTRVARLTVDSLIENCPDVAPFREDTYRRDPPCRLQDVDRVVAGTERVTDWRLIRGVTAALLGTTSLMILGGTAYCAIACEEDLGWDRGVTWVGIGAGLAALSVLIVPKDR